MRKLLARMLLRVSGLPSLGPVELSAGGEQRFVAAADALLAHGEAPLDIGVVTLLRWLAERRPVLFHGSGRDDLTVLEPIRLSRDALPFGDQQAVFASSDPVWAMWFAILRRGEGFRGTRNGSLAPAGQGLYPRRYFFSVNENALTPDRFRRGFLYLLPREPFCPEPPRFGLDSAQWASIEAVRPLARVDVAPADFPFLEVVVPHAPDEGVLRTILRARRRRRADRSMPRRIAR